MYGNSAFVKKDRWLFSSMLNWALFTSLGGEYGVEAEFRPGVTTLLPLTVRSRVQPSMTSRFIEGGLSFEMEALVLDAYEPIRWCDGCRGVRSSWL